MPELVDRSPSQQTQEPSDWWVGFVAHWKNQGFRKRKEWQPRISFGLQFRFRCLPARTTVYRFLDEIATSAVSESLKRIGLPLSVYCSGERDSFFFGDQENRCPTRRNLHGVC